MSTLNWSLLNVVHLFDKVKVITISNGVCQCRISNLCLVEKYSDQKYPHPNEELRRNFFEL